MVYKFKCRKCGKKYEDVNKRRYDYNVEQHKLKHKRENDKGKKREQKE